jgi:beta-lactam-binding protein with PASTA domain
MVEVEPGQSASTELRVRNQGTIVDQIGVQVSGPAAGWTTCEPPSVNLYPDSDGTVAVRFSPPRAPEPNAGTLPFQVRVTSNQDPSVSVVEGGMVTVGVFEELASELTPSTGQGRSSAAFQLATRNHGNSPAELGLDANDPDERLRCDVAPASLRCRPGDTQVTAVDVRAKARHWVGSPQRHPFSVTATRPGDRTHAPVFQQQGTFAQKALLPYWLLAVVAVLLILGMLAFMFLRSDSVSVPRVIGQTEEDAETSLIAAGLILGQTEFELSDEPQETVIAQDPEPDTNVEPGTQVNITVAAEELVDIPALVGSTLEIAEASLQQQRLVVGEVTEEVSDQDEGTVLEQDPAPGELVPPDTGIDLTIAVHVDVPRVIGQSEGPAQQALREAGLEMNVAAREENAQPEGVVIAQSPDASESVPAGTVIDVTLSLGPGEDGNGQEDRVRVPNVQGDRLPDARNRIEGGQLRLGDITEEFVLEDVAEGPSGRVVRQNPGAGMDVAIDTAIDLVLRAVVVDEGSLRLTQELQIDLDTGEHFTTGACCTEGADLVWSTIEVEVPQLVPLGGAQLANLGAMDPDEFGRLRLDQLESAEFTGREIRDSEIIDGTVVAVRTNDVNYAKIRIVRAFLDLDIEWVTYEPSG